MFVCVPTPITQAKDPDLGPVLRGGRRRPRRTSGRPARRPPVHHLPGHHHRHRSGRRSRSRGLVAGRDFDLAFAPERVNPGDPASAPRTVPRLVGGIDPGGHGARRRAPAPRQRPRSSSSPRRTRPSSPSSSRTSFRNVNIALVNQLALLCERMGLDVWEVIDAAATKPFGFMPFRPGPGRRRPLHPGRPVLPRLAGPRVRLRRPLRGAGRRHQPRDAAPRRRPRRRGAQRARPGAQGRPCRGHRRGLQAERARRAQLAGRRRHRGLIGRGASVTLPRPPRAGVPPPGWHVDGLGPPHRAGRGQRGRRRRDAPRRGGLAVRVRRAPTSSSTRRTARGAMSSGRARSCASAPAGSRPTARQLAGSQEGMR